MNKVEIEELEQIFKALSDATRLRILQMIYSKGMCVYDIYKKLEISQPAVSHHLKILKQADLIQSKKRGKWVIYSLNEKRNDFHQIINNYAKKSG